MDHPELTMINLKSKTKQKFFCRAQVAVELVAGIIVLFILFYGMARIFFYVNTAMVMRQKAYQDTRNQITSSNYKNFYTHHNLHIFPTEGDLYEP
jgi:hypothetical protein